MTSLTHFDDSGASRMVDVGRKDVTHREARAAAFVVMQPETLRLILDRKVTVSLHGRTGVEMEALTAVSVAALTVYDMCKAVDRGMTIGPIQLLEKSGGKSGHYVRESGAP